MRCVFILLIGCGHPLPPIEGPVGQESRPYTTLPTYLAHPIAEHDMTASEQLNQMSALLREIDAQAGALDGGRLPQQQEALRERVQELRLVVPPKPDMQAPVERMKLVVDEMPKTPPEDTRRRLWALTDLVRLRTHF